MRLWLVLAALAGALGVAAGAYLAHGAALTGPAERLASTALAFQLWHALALLGVAVLARDAPAAASRPVHAAGVLFAAGMVLFCGALYASAFAGLSPVPVAAPAGGLALIGGWLALGVAGLLWRRRPQAGSP